MQLNSYTLRKSYEYCRCMFAIICVILIYFACAFVTLLLLIFWLLVFRRSPVVIRRFLAVLGRSRPSLRRLRALLTAEERRKVPPHRAEVLSGRAHRLERHSVSPTELKLRRDANMWRDRSGSGCHFMLSRGVIMFYWNFNAFHMLLDVPGAFRGRISARTLPSRLLEREGGRENRPRRLFLYLFLMFSTVPSCFLRVFRRCSLHFSM